MAKVFLKTGPNVKAINLTKNQTLATNLEIADTFLSRLRGLSGKTTLGSGYGLLIKSCKGVHTFGMEFPIDVIFIDRENNVLVVRNELKPNKMTHIFFRAFNVLELPAGTIDSTGTAIGDKIGIV